MRFSPNDYFEASADRFREANAAFQRGDYFTAHLASGLAIECMLRAYRVRVSPDFDARHDLSVLGNPLLVRVASKQREDVHIAISEANILWRNNHRYCSARKLVAFFNGIRRYQKSRDMLRTNAGDMISHADVIIRNGLRPWQTP